MEKQYDHKQQFQKENLFEDEILENEPNPQQSSYQSTYLQKYRNFFHTMLQSHSIDHYANSLVKHKITYNKGRFCAEPCIIYLSQSQNGNVVYLSVSISYFHFQISVFNSIRNSPTKAELQLYDLGAMGNVYSFADRNKNQYIIKNINYNINLNQAYITEKPNEISQRNLRSAILQCCFNKLFSALEIGPYFLNPFGFDLVIYNESIEFAIERCKKVEIDPSFECLKSALRFMHSFNIIHGDIKPQNIMWSPKYNKLVFIDFGMTKAIRQNLGELSQTKFFGSYNYTMEQMKKVFLNKEYGYVDLYYNDVYALITSRQADRKTYIENKMRLEKLKGEKKQMSKIPSYEFSNHISNLKLSYLIFSRNFEEINIYLREGEINYMNENSLQMFLQLPISFQFINIFNRIAEFFNLNGTMVEKIRTYLERKNPQMQNKAQNNLFTRIKQVVNEEKVPINSMMVFTKLFFNQDISPLALIKKNEAWKKILAYYYINKQENNIDCHFWILFVEYVSNLYTKKQEIEQVFEIAKKILNMEQWQFEIQSNDENIPNKLKHENPITKSFHLFVKAKQIVEQVKKLFNIDLIPVELDSNDKNQQKIQIGNGDTMIYCFRRNFQNQQFLNNSQLIKKYQQIVTILQSDRDKKNTKQYLSKIRQLLTKSIKNCENQGIILLLQIMELQSQYLNIQYNYNKKLKVYTKFSKYKLIGKSRPVLFINKMLFFISKTRQNYQNVAILVDSMQRNFYNYCFQADIQLPIIMYQIIFMDILKQANSFSLKQLKKCLKYFLNISNMEILRIRKNLKQLIFGMIDALKDYSKWNENIKQCISYLVQQILNMYYFEGYILNDIDFNNVNPMLEYFNLNYRILEECCQAFEEVKAKIQSIYRLWIEAFQKIKNNYKLDKFNKCKFFVHKLNFQYLTHKSTVDEIYKEMEKLEKQYNLIDKSSKDLSWLFLDIVSFTNINPQQFYEKLLNFYKKEGKLQRFVLNSNRALAMLHHHYQKELAKKLEPESRYKYEQKCQYILITVISLVKDVYRLVQTENEYITGYYMVAINNTFLILTGNYGFMKGLNFIVDSITVKLREIVSNHKSEALHNNLNIFSNITPILQEVLNVLIDKNIDLNQDIEQITVIITKCMKLISFLIPYCYNFYRSRINIKYFHILKWLTNKGIPIFHHIYHSSPYNQNKQIQKIINLVERKRYRTHQYPISDASVIKLCRNLKNKLKTASAVEIDDYYQHGNPRTVIKHCLKMQEKIYYFNNNKQQKIIFKERVAICKKYEAVYHQMINQDTIVYCLRQ